MPETTASRTEARNAVWCAAAVAAAFLIVNPFVRMPFDDDWSYAFTVRQLIRTGHITYNGWSAPLIITHVWWGAMFAKIFGYSFIVLRFSTLPFAVGCAAVAYLLARRANVRPANSIFFALLLCLSPLFLPLAESYMTDVPALFFILLCLYAFIRAGATREAGRPLAWLIIGVLFGILGGMNRQTVWVVPLSVLPYLIFVRRRELAFVAAATAGWLLVVADIVLCMRWFGRQPWCYFDPPMLSSIRMGLAKPGIFAGNLVAICLTTLMLILPASLPFVFASAARLWRLRKTWHGAVHAVVFCLLGWAIVRNPNFGLPPWLFNILSIHGVLDGLELSGHRPVALPVAVRCFLSVLVLLSGFLILGRFTELIFEPRTTFAKLRVLLAEDSRALPVLAIFGSSYFALMIIRSAQDLVFDRYCLPLIACVAVPFLRSFKPRACGLATLAIAWSLLAVYSAYGLASTQDVLALAAARRAAVDRLESSGADSTEIAGGFEYNFYTQLEQAGHINRYGIRNPANAYNPNQGYTPALKCRYRLEWQPYVDTMPSRFGTINYFSWLPPFHRRIFIDQFKHPWWLAPHPSNKTPLPRSYEVLYD